MTPPIGIVSLETASPPYELSQDEVLETVLTHFGDRFPLVERLAPVFANSGIRTRQAVRPLEWYLESRGWPERSATYLEGALDLFCDAAGKALAAAGLTGADVDVIVTASTTGVATPSLEARAMGRMGFRPDAARVPVFGIGCAGGATGLALASRLAAAQPGATVLFVTVELCTLAFRNDEVSATDIVATALFGDGAAACVLRSGEDGFARVASYAEHTWPDSLDVMGWRMDGQGLGVVLSQFVPPFVQKKLRPAMETMLAAQGLGMEDVDRFICHPGGAKVIEALETALDLGQGALDVERDVLRAHGNMSAPTVLFILDRIRRHGLPPRSVLTAMGPGFTASTVALLAA
ncbi:type III polyketide synthase [Phenylobacterium sp.]|uniref:type III polyketide synthase n=1 Tax=Phenylobacterium sp. TaxID=1871053 RepID=UPI002DEF4901|nr:3-oxoacyl-[acyl-carrier-protein] synthase III C-terminal domain-containing protein [Phenylobacterium sp.]